MMITEQTRIIILQLTDELLAQLQPFMAGLDLTATPHREWAYQEVYEQGHFAGYEKAEQRRQRLTLRGDVYDALVERVNGALDYDVRWQPNEYESDGFIERVRPLELTNGTHEQAGCPQCGAQLLANRAEVTCACGQAVALGKSRRTSGWRIQSYSSPAFLCSAPSPFFTASDAHEIPLAARQLGSTF
jgi:hypothetical protein